jgi:hypothetical protein
MDYSPGLEFEHGTPRSPPQFTPHKNRAGAGCRKPDLISITTECGDFMSKNNVLLNDLGQSRTPPFSVFEFYFFTMFPLYSFLVARSSSARDAS